MPTINTSLQPMISLRGSVKDVQRDQVEIKKAQGWKVVNNPKRSYYPEFDQEAGGRSAPETISDDLNDDDTLPFEEI